MQTRNNTIELAMALALIFTMATVTSVSAAVRCAVLGYEHYQDGYIHQLQAAGIGCDTLSGRQLTIEPVRQLLKYHAIFIALGIDRVGIDSAYRKKLALYVKSGGVLVLEQKARMKFGPIAFTGKSSTHQFHITAAAKPWFNHLSPKDSIAYAGYLYTLKPSSKLTVLAASNGKPVMAFGRYGQGWVLYSGASSSFAARKGTNKTYVRLVDATITWALSRKTTRQLPASLQAVNQAMKNNPHIPPSKNWIWNMRIVGMDIPSDPDERSLIRKALEYKKQGVNTIMDHGSFQFVPLPNPPHKTRPPQWKMPVHYQAAKTFTDAMHKAGMRVIHHTTSTFVPIQAMKVPEYHFFSRDIRTGKVALRKKGTAYDDAVFADMNSPQFRSIIFPRMAKYMRVVRPDAFMTDEVEWLPDIYAGGTKRGSEAKFRREYGFGYPTGDALGNWKSTVWRAYVKFRFDSGGDFYHDLLAVLKKENPDAYITGCLAGISAPWKRVWAQGSQSWLAGLNLIMFEGEQGSAPHPKSGGGFLYASLWPTYYREMSLYDAAAEMNHTVAFELSYPQTWKVPNSAQFYCWAQASLMGMRYWMRDYQAEPQWYAWEAAHEKDLTHPRWINDIGIFFPGYSRVYTADAEPIYEDWSGISEALAQNAVQADQIMRWHLEKLSRLKRFRLLILPSAHFLTPKMAANLEQFVRQGGKLLVTADTAVTSLFKSVNDHGSFNRLLGIKPAAWVDGDSKTVVATRTGPIPKGIYPFDGGYERVQAYPGTRVLARVAGTNDPAIVEHRVGQGEVIYFSGRIGTQAYQTAHQRHLSHFTLDANLSLRRQLAKLASNILGDQRRITIIGLPANVMTHAHDTFGRGPDDPRLTIHLLNSVGRYHNGEPWPKKATPLPFPPIAQRTGNRPIQILLRNLPGVKAAKLISPAFKGAKSLDVSHDVAAHADVVIVPAKALGRYSVVVVTPTKAAQ